MDFSKNYLSQIAALVNYLYALRFLSEALQQLNPVFVGSEA